MSGGRSGEELAATTVGEDDSEGPPEFDEGRYVYCVVRADEDRVLEDVTGLEDEPVSVVTVDGVGAVVHACADVYDSADLAEIRRWLVRHQTVVDAAAERFGTPLPFQFDTIVRGDDGTVQGWLREERETLADVLESLAGHWEYRIEVVRTDPVETAVLEAEDEVLADLRERIEAAAEGEAFLLEKQYDRRVADRRRERREALSADLRDRLAAHAREVHELERSPTASLGDGRDGDRDGGETVCRLTVLAHADAEGDVGAVLDDVAAEPGLEVRFTGPWPPYTFVPDLGGDPDGRGDDSAADAGEPGGGRE